MSAAGPLDVRDTTVYVTNPDDAFGAPVEQAADRMHHWLAPGVYDAHTSFDDEPRPVRLVVAADGLSSYGEYADMVAVTVLVPLRGRTADKCDVATVTGDVREALEKADSRYATRPNGLRTSVRGTGADPDDTCLTFVGDGL